MEERQISTQTRAVHADLLRAIISAAPENEKPNINFVSRSILDLSMFGTLTTINAVSWLSPLHETRARIN